MKTKTLLIIFLFVSGLGMAQAKKDSSLRINIQIDKDDNGKRTRIDTVIYDSDFSDVSKFMDMENIRVLIKEKANEMAEMDIDIEKMIDSIGAPLKRMNEEIRVEIPKIEFDRLRGNEFAFSFSDSNNRRERREIRVDSDHHSCCKHHHGESARGPAYGKKGTVGKIKLETIIDRKPGMRNKVIIIED